MINTLSISRELTKSGLKREHAEAIADAVAEAIAQQNGNLATTEFVHTRISEMQKGTDGKIDILRMEVGDLRVEVSELRVDVSELRSHIDTQIASVRVEISELRADMSTLDAKISASETRVVRWVVGIAIAMGIFQALFDHIPSLISGLV